MVSKRDANFARRDSSKLFDGTKCQVLAVLPSGEAHRLKESLHPLIAIGCLSLIVLPLIGLAVGGYVGGLAAAIWSAFGGLIIAALVCGVGVLALLKARPR
jgi:uncharacterized membrane protein